MANENDDWEVAVDTGEFDKRIEQQEKDRAARQMDLFKESIPSTVNDNENRNLISSNKPIRILKRPTSQSQLPVSNDINNSSQITNSTFTNEIPTIKTYEQREQEYRLARLRIMGEEESSVKDDDDDDVAIERPITIESTPVTSDNTSRIIQSSATYTTGAIHFTPDGQQYQPVYSAPYPPMALPCYPPVHLYNYPVQPTLNPWYQYQQERTQPYGHPR